MPLWCIDLEINLAERYNWSLHDIDETDARNLLQLYFRLAERNGATPNRAVRTVYADQVDWI